MSADSTSAAKSGFHFRDITKAFGSTGGHQMGIFVALALIVLFFAFTTSGRIVSVNNLIDIVNQQSYILILAIGMVMVIIMGHIDLSVGSVAAFVGVVAAKVMNDAGNGLGWPWYVGVLIGLVAAVIAGAWQGFWVAYVGVPAFIVTLAGMQIFRGLNQLIGNSSAVPVPSSFNWVSGYMPDIGPFAFNLPTMLIAAAAAAWIVYSEFSSRRSQARHGVAVTPMWVTVTKIVLLGGGILALGWYFATAMSLGGQPLSFPVSGVILVAFAVLYTIVLNRTRLGRYIYAVGGNRTAARLSGIKDKRIDFFVMLNMSVLAGVAGMMWVSRSRASGAADGTMWELDAIAAVFIGGAAVSGGVGTVVGSIIGGLVMAFLNNGMALMSVDASWQKIIKGLVLLIAVAIDVWNKQAGRPSITGMLIKGLNLKKQGPAGFDTPVPIPGAK